MASSVLMNRKQRRAAEKLERTKSDGPAGTAKPVHSAATEQFATGLQHHKAGKLAEAEACYRQVLAVQPNHADTLHLLGVVLLQGGRHALAIELIRRAVQQSPRNPGYLCNLGLALKEHGKLDEAISTYRHAIAIKPDYTEAHYNLGNALSDQGKLDDAMAAYRRAIGIKPDLAEAHYNLGNVLKQQGKLEDAINAYRRAISIRPDIAEAHLNLGNVLRDQGKLDEAIGTYRNAVGIKPDYAEAHSNLGNALKEQGKLDEATGVCREAISIKPELAEAHYNLGNALREQGKLDEAIVAYRRAIGLKPGYAEAHSNLGLALTEEAKLNEAIAACRQAIGIQPNLAEAHYNLGNALKELGKLEDAVAAYRRAIGIKPGYVEAHSNLGNTLSDQGKLGDAITAYRCAIDIKPDLAKPYSNLLLCLNYHDKITNQEIFAEHLEWGARIGGQVPRPVRHANDCDAGRRLRIGYLSPDFCGHPVAYFLEPLLKAHDRQAVEVFCYAEVLRQDTVTARLQGFADHWLVTVGLSDDEINERIRADGIDILVDLAGHTARNRLRIFAHKPAPIQVTWLGYPNTTGLTAMDYRLVDAVTDPPGEADAFTSEMLIRLEGGFVCYAGLNGAPEPADASYLRTGTVTFGSFNNPAKLSAATIDAWARLLLRLPRSRLLLKGKSFADAVTRALFLSKLSERGVAAERVELLAWLPSSAAHLALYERIDIALDPFPYNGATTTCEALWMGVPVVTLRGDRHAGRVGASLLSQIGMTELIANSVEEYVEIALALASNPGRLTDLRHSLRPRLASSSLCDGPAFARKIEAAYRHMWLQWCEAQDNRQ